MTAHRLISLFLGLLIAFFLLSLSLSARNPRAEAFESPPGAQHVIMNVQSGFLSPTECDRIAHVARTQGFLPSRVVSDGKAIGAMDTSVRISEQAWLKPEKHPEVMTLYRRVEKLTGIPMSRYEDMQVVRYQEGGHYKEHYDCCQDDEGCEDFWSLGGRRLFTVLIYLNGREEVLEGGETEFPRIRLRVAPEKGKMLWFRNIREDGRLEPDSLHAGRPVVRGKEKIACQIWIRQRDRPERTPPRMTP